MTCWIYDLDGVVTSLTEKRITNPRLYGYFVQQLEKEESVTINTGRGLSFIREQVLTPLLNHIQKQGISESLLHNFFAVGEKGNAWIEDEKDCFDMTTAIPQDFAQKVQTVVERDFSDTMFFDTTKKTMISLEMHTGLAIEKFMNVREELIQTLESLLQESGLEKEYAIDPTLTAADIQHKTAGKAKGTERILAWMEKRDTHPDEFVAFGDSAADIETGEALQKQEKQFTFVFVGDPKLIRTQPSFPITFTKEGHDKGVVEYLQEN